MRCAKWTGGHQRTPGGQEARNRVDASDRDGLGHIQRRHDARQPAREHGLATAWGADHKNGVGAGSRDLECPAGVGLTMYVAQVPKARRLGLGDEHVGASLYPHRLIPVLQHVHRVAQSAHPQDLDARHQRRLGRICLGNHKASPSPAGCVLRHHQCPGHRSQGAVQGQFAHGARRRQRAGAYLPRSAQQGERNGQVVLRPRLSQIRWREVGHDANGWQVKCLVDDPRPHPLPGLLHRGVR